MLLSAAPATVAASGAAASTPTTASNAPAVANSAASGPTINVDTTLSLTPERAGSIGVVQRFELPSSVTGLRVTLDSGVTVTGTTGFSRESDGVWSWDGETADPTLRYRKQANQTSEADGPMGAEGSYLFADVGPWALVRTPNIGLQWRYRGSESISIARSTSVAGEGAVGATTAFLGPHETYTRSANGQTFRLIVPEAAELSSQPRRVLRGLANASGAMQVGDRDPEVFAVAAPTTGSRWAVQGLQVGSHDFWVRDSQSVSAVGNAWLHEYVHTRQSFETAESGRWFVEASATWYATLLSLQEGATDNDLQRYLSRGEAEPQASAVLTEPRSWQNNANYWKGALVLGELDRRIRLDTNQSASLQTVFGSLNGRTGPVENADIVAEVAGVSTASTERAAKRFTTTTANPEVWSNSAHREAFSSQPAQMRLRFDPTSDLHYAGPFRNSSVEQPVTVAAGERLSFRSSVRNVGDATGNYTVALRVGDGLVANRTGRLAPGEEATAQLSHRFDEPGTYAVTIAGKHLEVVVREPATLSVAELRVDRGSATVGGSVVASATVENRNAVPGNRTVVFTRNGEAVARQTVTLGPGESETVSATVSLPEAGEVAVGAGERSVTLNVREQGLSRSDVPVPGFGAPVAAVALLAVAGLLRRFSSP